MQNYGNIKLVNIKVDKNAEYDIYIGRSNKWLGLDGTKWGNPYPMKNEGERSKVLEQYREYILARPILIKSLKELKGKTLACYCTPKKCHGDILIELYDEFVYRRKFSVRIKKWLGEKITILRWSVS